MLAFRSGSVETVLCVVLWPHTTLLIVSIPLDPNVLVIFAQLCVRPCHLAQFRPRPYLCACHAWPVLAGTDGAQLVSARQPFLLQCTHVIISNLLQLQRLQHESLSCVFVCLILKRKYAHDQLCCGLANCFNVFSCCSPNSCRNFQFLAYTCLCIIYGYIMNYSIAHQNICIGVGYHQGRFQRGF